MHGVYLMKILHCCWICLSWSGIPYYFHWWGNYLIRPVQPVSDALSPMYHLRYPGAVLSCPNDVIPVGHCQSRLQYVKEVCDLKYCSNSEVSISFKNRLFLNMFAFWSNHIHSKVSMVKHITLSVASQILTDPKVMVATLVALTKDHRKKYQLISGRSEVLD